jgi:hypothetical protein
MKAKKLKINTHKSIIVEHGKELLIPFSYGNNDNYITIEIREAKKAIIELVKFNCPEGRKIENGHKISNYIAQLFSQVFKEIWLKIDKENYTIDSENKENVMLLIRSMILQQIIYQ